MLAIGGHRVLNGEMSRGEMLEFMQYIGLLIFPLRNLGMTVAFGQRAAAAWHRRRRRGTTRGSVIVEPIIEAACLRPLVSAHLRVRGTLMP